MSEMIDVFRFKIWDWTTADWIVPPYKLTIEGIISCDGMIVPGSGEEVQEGALDEHRRYKPINE